MLAHRRVINAGRQEYRSIFAEATGEARLADIEPAHGAQLRTNATNVALELAAHGAEVTVALTALCATYLDRGLLAEPLALRPRSPWSYYLAHRATPRGSAAERLVAHLLASSPGAPG